MYTVKPLGHYQSLKFNQLFKRGLVCSEGNKVYFVFQLKTKYI